MKEDESFEDGNRSNEEQELESYRKGERLNGQMLRVRAIAALKSLERIFSMQESELQNYFRHEYKPISSFALEEVVTSAKTQLTRSETKLFIGEVEQKKKHGKGVLLWKEGKIYEGQFYLNDREGDGMEIYSNGNVYVGQFSRNKKHGSGIFYWFSLCQLPSQNLEFYHGGWWGGLPDGHGRHDKANGDVYVGSFKNGLKHGKGYESYGNGEKYKGQFVNGSSDGYGVYQWKDGSSYQGDFKQGGRSGYGVWKNPESSQTYQGQYMMDKKHGYGIYDWGNGYLYKGYFIEDVRFGQGTLLFNNEVQYSGYWENGKERDKKPEKIQLEQENRNEVELNFAFNQMKSFSPGQFSHPFNEKERRDKIIEAPLFIEKEKKPPVEKEYYISFRHLDPSEGKSKRVGHQNCVPSRDKVLKSRMKNKK